MRSNWTYCRGVRRAAPVAVGDADRIVLAADAPFDDIQIMRVGGGDALACRGTRILQALSSHANSYASQLGSIGYLSRRIGQRKTMRAERTHKKPYELGRGVYYRSDRMAYTAGRRLVCAKQHVES